jgi:hypothetical protein
MSGKTDPNFRPKEKPLAFSKLPPLLRKRYGRLQSRIQWIGTALDRDLIHIGFTGGGCEYWQKKGRVWVFLIGGFPSASDLPSLLGAVA